MGLNANAIITVDEFLTLTGRTRDAYRIPAFRIYGGATGATATTAGKAGNNLVLIITGGASAGTTTIDLSAGANDTLTELLAVINALGKGYTVNRLTAGAYATTDLFDFGTTNCLLVANEQTLYGFDSGRIEAVINSVSTFVESFTRRIIADQTLTEYYNGSGNVNLVLKSYPINSITSVQAWDAQAQAVEESYTEHTDYEGYYNEGLLYNPALWGIGHKNYKVVYNAGYTTIPEDIKQATALMCSYIINTAGKQGIKSETIGRYSVSYGGDKSNSVMGYAIPPEIINILAPYIKWDMA